MADTQILHAPARSADRAQRGTAMSGAVECRLAAHEVSRLHAAAHHARRVHPGPVGELLHRELTAFAEFGHRFAHDALLPRLATEILRTPVTTRSRAAPSGPRPSGA